MVNTPNPGAFTLFNFQGQFEKNNAEVELQMLTEQVGENEQEYILKYDMWIDGLLTGVVTECVASTGSSSAARTGPSTFVLKYEHRLDTRTPEQMEVDNEGRIQATVKASVAAQLGYGSKKMTEFYKRTSPAKPIISIPQHPEEGVSWINCFTSKGSVYEVILLFSTELTGMWSRHQIRPWNIGGRNLYILLLFFTFWHYFWSWKPIRRFVFRRTDRELKFEIDPNSSLHIFFFWTYFRIAYSLLPRDARMSETAWQWDCSQCLCIFQLICCLRF